MNRVLTKDDLVEIVRLHRQEGFSQRKIAKMMGCGKTTLQDFFLRKSHKEFWKEYDKKPIASGSFHSEHTNDNAFEVNKTYVICAAQNNTFIHKNFFKAIQTFCEYNNAELLVSTFLYNINGFQKPKEDEGTWYDEDIRPFICNSRLRLAKDLVFCGELNIFPTTKYPCNGYQTYAGRNDIIVPHTKQELLSVATEKNLPAKVVYSTGAITLRNYIQRAVGQQAEEVHKYGALVVEVDNEGYSYVRQIECINESGEFYDLDVLYSDNAVVTNQRVEAVNWGDIHAAKLDEEIADISWRAPYSLLDYLRPKYQFVHDIFDMQARNHHSRKNQVHRLTLAQNNLDSVEDEIAHTCRVLKGFERDFSKVVIVESNHDKALEKWLDDADYRDDDTNATYFLKLQYARYKWLTEDYTGDEDSLQSFPVFEFACRDKFDFSKDKFQFLSTNSVFIICDDINCGQHGHLGNNGARGSVLAYATRNMRYNIGHVHSPSIKGGVFAAGVSGKLDMGYNNGGSSWSHAHIVTYPNGTRTLVFIKNGKFKA